VFPPDPVLSQDVVRDSSSPPFAPGHGLPAGCWPAGAGLAGVTILRPEHPPVPEHSCLHASAPARPLAPLVAIDMKAATSPATRIAHLTASLSWQNAALGSV